MQLERGEARRFLRSAMPRVLHNQQEVVQAVSQGMRVQTINLHHLALIEEDPAFRSAARAADRFTADGWPVSVVWRALGSKAEQSTGAEFVEQLTVPAAVPPTKIGLLGSGSTQGAAFREQISAAGHDLVW